MEGDVVATETELDLFPRQSLTRTVEEGIFR
jgi:hypothetical protein